MTYTGLTLTQVNVYIYICIYHISYVIVYGIYILLLLLYYTLPLQAVWHAMQ